MREKPKTLTKAQALEMASLFGPPPVLSTEDVRHYNQLWEKLVECLMPRDFFELLLIWQVLNETWKMLRYTRHQAVGVERCYRQSQEFQAQLVREQKARGERLAKERAEKAGKPATELEKLRELEAVVFSSIADVDEISERTPKEIDHNKALAAGILVHQQLDQLINSAMRRRDGLLDQLELYREGLGQSSRQISDDIIDGEYREIERPAAQVVAPPLAPGDQVPAEASSARDVQVPPNAEAAPDDQVPTQAQSVAPVKTRLAEQTGYMSSKLKIETNRLNGRKGRGPRSAAGKAIASRNALRHGLSAIVHRPAVTDAEIERFAKALCGAGDDSALYQQACIIAHDHFVRRAIMAQELAVIERVLEPTAIALAKGDNTVALMQARMRKGELACELLVAMRDRFLEKYKEELPNPVVPSEIEGLLTERELLIPAPLEELLQEKEDKLNSQAPRDNQENPANFDQVVAPTKERDDSAALAEAALDLIRLDRYERRAWSAQKRAMRAFMVIKLNKRLRPDGLGAPE